MSEQPETRSERFRRRVFDAYEEDTMSPSDFEAVDEVCAILDVIDRLRDALREGPLTEVRQGGARPRAELVEMRLQQASLEKWLRRFPALSEDV